MIVSSLYDFCPIGGSGLPDDPLQIDPSHPLADHGQSCWGDFLGSRNHYCDQRGLSGTIFEHPWGKTGKHGSFNQWSMGALLYPRHGIFTTFANWTMKENDAFDHIAMVGRFPTDKRDPVAKKHTTYTGLILHHLDPLLKLKWGICIDVTGPRLTKKYFDAFAELGRQHVGWLYVNYTANHSFGDDAPDTWSGKARNYFPLEEVFDKLGHPPMILKRPPTIHFPDYVQDTDICLIVDPPKGSGTGSGGTDLYLKEARGMTSAGWCVAFEPYAWDESPHNPMAMAAPQIRSR